MLSRVWPSEPTLWGSPHCIRGLMARGHAGGEPKVTLGKLQRDRDVSPAQRPPGHQHTPLQRARGTPARPQSGISAQAGGAQATQLPQSQGMPWSPPSPSSWPQTQKHSLKRLFPSLRLGQDSTAAPGVHPQGQGAFVLFPLLLLHWKPAQRKREFLLMYMPCAAHLPTAPSSPEASQQPCYPK